MKFKISNSINLYLSGLENLIQGFSRIPNRNISVLINRLPFISKINYKLIHKIVWFIFLIGEPIVSVLIETIMVIPYIIKVGVSKKKSISNYLCITDNPLLSKRIMCTDMHHQIKDWVYISSAKLKNNDSTKEIHEIYEYLQISDVILSYFESIVATFLSLRISKFRYVMRNYTSFEYFMMYKFLRNIPTSTTICFCNQIDKWALLFDDAPLRKVLFQHGIDRPTSNWPNKLKKTDTLYALSKEESTFLINAIFERTPNNIKILNPTISLSPIVDNHKFSILIIGFPGYIKVFFKPHPGKEDMTKYFALQEEYPTNCEIILTQTFPNVNIVVSYLSTLAIEYQALNKKVLMYEDYSIEEIENIIYQYYLKYKNSELQ